MSRVEHVLGDEERKLARRAVEALERIAAAAEAQATAKMSPRAAEVYRTIRDQVPIR